MLRRMSDDVIRDLTPGGVFHTIHNGEPRYIAHVTYTDESGKRRFIRGIAATERDAKRCEYQYGFLTSRKFLLQKRSNDENH